MFGRILTLGLFLLISCSQQPDERVNASGRFGSTAASSSTSGDATGQTDTTPGAGQPTAKDPNLTLAAVLPVSYASDLEPALQKLCTAACHQGPPTPGPPLLNSLTGVQTNFAKASAAIDAGRMPPNAATLTPSAKKFLAQLSLSLKTWGKDGRFSASLTDVKVTYKDHITLIANGICLGCHQGDTPKGGIRLETQAQWVTLMPRILSAVGNGSMPPTVDEVQQGRLLKVLTEWQAQAFP